MCKIETFNVIIPYTKKERRIWVYLPSGYSDSNLDYPVLYMHDGQNLFEPSTSYLGVIWDVHSAVEKAMVHGKTKGVIVVGIDNPSSDNEENVVGRLDEYSPWINSDLKNNLLANRITRDVGGYGKEYGKFIVEILKPMIDHKYRTKPDRENTGVAGSSMGGLISLYLGLAYEDVFSKIGAFSTAVWFAEKELLQMIKEHGPDIPMKWYLDIGTNESSNDTIKNFSDIYVKGTMEVYENLLAVGVKEENIKCVVDEGGVHNEEAWARRFPEAFEWLFCS